MIGEIRVTENCYDTGNNNKEVEVLTEWDYAAAPNDDLVVQRCVVLFPNGTRLQVQKHQLKKMPNGGEASSWDKCVWKPDSVFA